MLNFQSDGGQLKQEVSVLSTFDQKKDIVKQEYAGLTSAGGKKAIDVALVAQQRLNLFRERQPPLYPPPVIDGGGALDSGCGTPESHTVACRELVIYGPHALLEGVV